jgi:glyoxylase-like metal-dependent hydrolase (beta-lactamase superfamily II)
MIARVNGVEVCDGNSGAMHHTFEDCIEYVSRCETLHPGEIIASGTVGGGSGFERFTFLKPNDEIELEVEGIGIVKNRIVPGPTRKNPNPIVKSDVMGKRWSDLALDKFSYTKGLVELSRGVYAWLLPDGAWGLSNAGLIVDSGVSMVVDTLYDLVLTAEMLEAMKAAEPEAVKKIDFLVNTHGDGDHWFGNELVDAGDIYASTLTMEHIKQTSPGLMALMTRVFPPAPTALGRMIGKHFSRYQFEGITPTYPNKAVSDRLSVNVGSRPVELIVVGPAHTPGDMLVYLPEERILFAGDIVFVHGTPVVHSGPISRYVQVLQDVLKMDIDIVVPGHGPITDKSGVEAMIEYLEYVYAESEKRYKSGMSARRAAGDIDLGEFLQWNEPDRIIYNVLAAYREFSKSPMDISPLEKMYLLSELGDY